MSCPEQAAGSSLAADPPAAFDLADCWREPIHTPGAIQPHGALLAVRADTLLVSHASANLAAFLDRSAESVLGRKLAEVIGEAACRAPHGVLPPAGAAHGQIHSLSGLDGRTLDLRAHRSGPYICLDIEPVGPEPGQRPPVILMQSVLETFRQAVTRGELCELAVRGLRAITGYDRVMAYRFHADGHGEVIAEARTAGLEPFLGLHYPAADVPAQARRLYLRQRVGSIANSNYRPVPLLVDPALDDGTPLDLTHSALRSASPVHREYMRNMNTAASLTVGLARSRALDARETAPMPSELKPESADSAAAANGDQLWGMLVCHHGTPFVAGAELRAVAGMIGQVVSLLLASLGEAEVYAGRLARDATLRRLAERLTGIAPLPDVLTAAGSDLMGLLDAGGALIRINGARFCLGRAPPLATAERMLATLWPRAGGEMLAIDQIGRGHPDLAGCSSEAAGTLLLPLARDTDDAILWFRPELSRDVTWGGNPAGHVSFDSTNGRLSPRTSFAAWSDTVRGRSEPWTEADLALAGQLRTVIGTAVAQRNKAALAQLRYYDSLTGLPNRSLLRERLREIADEPVRDAGMDPVATGHRAAAPARTGHAGTDDDGAVFGGTGTALLFLDLDRFKAVNDTMGHVAGDALLIEVARRLRAEAGSDHMAARLGGDEFVVLCRGLSRDAVADLAERIRRAIEAPFEIAGRPCHVSVSIGIAVADQSGGLDLIRAADMAMYAAKASGGNRGVVFESALFDRAAQQFELDLDMREALRAGDQLALLYQPLFGIDGGTKTLIGFEALIRWRHPRRGWLSPAHFIPLAEKSGLILPIGEWVLAKALRQGRALSRVHPGLALRMAVNVSTLQLSRSDFCSGLAGVMEAEGFPPPALCLEVTESILANAVATAVLATVRELGVRVAIDDFGIGYSSLSYLRRLPVDVVKLDRSFLEDVEGDPNGGDFVRAVIALAHAAGKPVVFEGIETQAQYALVSAAGADVVQGFFFAPPLSANAAEELVRQYRLLDEQRAAVPLLKGPGLA
jgi:diguanylate cyclase (GGDEF)-like protein